NVVLGGLSPKRSTRVGRRETSSTGQSMRSESSIKHSLSSFLAAGDQPTFPCIKYLIIFPDRHEDFWFSFSRSQKRRGRQTDPFFNRPSFRPRCATSRSRPSH